MTGRPRLLASVTIVSAAAACILAPVLLDAATVWLPASDLSAAGGAASGAKVAADATGGMIVVWRRFDGSGAAQIQVTTRTPQSGAWSSPRTLASDDVNVPDVAVDPTGGATVVWKRFDGNNYVIQAVAKSSQGVWAATPLNISQTGQNANDPDVTVDTKGIATAVWKRFDGNNFVIQASTRSAAGIWETPVTISLAGADAANPHVASDAAGNLVASWKRYDGNNNLVEVARRPIGGAWTTPQTLSAPGQHGNGPLVAVGPEGTTAVSWFRSDGSSSLVQAATGPAATGLYPADTLSVPGQDAVNARVAVDGTGTVLAVWRRFDGSHDVIQFASKPLNGQWTAPERLSDAGQDANSADITADSAGNVLVSWVRREGADDVTRVVGAVARIVRGLLVTADPLVQPGGLKRAMQRRRQPDGKHREGDEAAEGGHTTKERIASRIVNAAPGSCTQQTRWG